MWHNHIWSGTLAHPPIVRRWLRRGRPTSICRILRSAYVRIRSCSTADVLVLVRSARAVAMMTGPCSFADLPVLMRTTRTVSTMLTSSHWGGSVANGLVSMLARSGMRLVSGLSAVPDSRVLNS
ncbi:hypothetical protein WR25_03964 [Diploscapter pachys]|uniref:Uncharacterized protein n=1 Tax=Diploscapter pachys TaxID=2018661 RepID=A0A2A2JKJ6_9BILA|nr:hypothetical protein WR25_03964 [Diploscapter pachys]